MLRILALVLAHAFPSIVGSVAWGKADDWPCELGLRIGGGKGIQRRDLGGTRCGNVCGSGNSG